MQALIVKPGADEIRDSLVACWDQDEAHFRVNPVWQQFGGAHIVGDPAFPDVTYTVADTLGVQEAARKGRIVILERINMPEVAAPDQAAPAERKPPAGSNEAQSQVAAPEGEQPPAEETGKRRR